MYDRALLKRHERKLRRMKRGYFWSHFPWINFAVLAIAAGGFYMAVRLWSL